MPTSPHPIAVPRSLSSQPARSLPQPATRIEARPGFRRTTFGHVLSATQAAPARLLALWHLCSLDAPTIAALWVVFIAQAANVYLPWTEPASMFVAVWTLYAADRLLDARLLSAGAHEAGASRLELRHRFHARHRSTFLASLLLAFPLLTLLLRRADPAGLRLDVFLGAVLLVWLLLVHRRQGAASRLPKELAVGIVFPAAVFIPTVARAPWLRPVLLPDALLFAAACSLNCLYIFAWEHPHSSRGAHWTTRWAVERLPSLTTSTALAALLTAFVFAILQGRTLAAPALACSLSAGLLLWLHRERGRLSSVALRAGADASLLTPLLLLLFAWLLTR